VLWNLWKKESQSTISCWKSCFSFEIIYLHYFSHLKPPMSQFIPTSSSSTLIATKHCPQNVMRQKKLHKRLCQRFVTSIKPVDSSALSGLNLCLHIKHCLTISSCESPLSSCLVWGALESKRDQVNKQEIPCTTEARSTFFGWTGSNPRFLGFFIFSMQFLFDRVQSCSMLEI
jgi:hypothetical protein